MLVYCFECCFLISSLNGEVGSSGKVKSSLNSLFQKMSKTSQMRDWTHFITNTLKHNCFNTLNQCTPGTIACFDCFCNRPPSFISNFIVWLLENACGSEMMAITRRAGCVLTSEINGCDCGVCFECFCNRPPTFISNIVALLENACGTR